MLLQRTELLAQASKAADKTGRVSLNLHPAGLVVYTDAALSQDVGVIGVAALAQTLRDRQITSVRLIQALGAVSHPAGGTP